MRAYVAMTLPLALLAMSVPAQLSAQRGFGGDRAPVFHGAPAGRGFSAPPAIPRAPEPRTDGHDGPMFEPGRPHGEVPYVRDGHWYGHAAPGDARFHLDRPFQFGRFGLVGPGHVFRTVRVDLGARRLWLPGGRFEIADWDWALTSPWCWTCDDFVVYLDPDHVGWYLLYDVRMGEYVHAQFLGA